MALEVSRSHWVLVRAGLVEVVVMAVVVHGWRVLKPRLGLYVLSRCGLSTGPGLNFRSWFHTPLMTVVKGLVTNGVDFSGDRADSDAEEGTGEEPSRATQEASTPACHMVSGVY